MSASGRATRSHIYTAPRDERIRFERDNGAERRTSRTLGVSTFQLIDGRVYAPRALDVIDVKCIAARAHKHTHSHTYIHTYTHTAFIREEMQHQCMCVCGEGGREREKGVSARLQHVR